MTKKDKDNILSIHSGVSPSSIAKPVKWKSKYIPPQTAANPSEFFELPSNDKILLDLKICGGSFERLLTEIADEEDRRATLACQIMEQVCRSPADKELFDNTRIAAEQAALVRGRDEIIRMSKTKGQSQLGALKLLQEFSKDHKGKGPADPMDSHLEDMEEEV